MLPQLALQQTEGQRSAVAGHVELLEKIGQPADVVLVSVSDDHTSKLVDILLDVGKIRDDDINSQHLAVRKCQPAVDDQHIVCAFNNSEILSDLVESPQRDYLHRGASLGLSDLLCPFLLLRCSRCLLAGASPFRDSPLYLLTSREFKAALAGVPRTRAPPAAAFGSVSVF